MSFFHVPLAVTFIGIVSAGASSLHGAYTGEKSSSASSDNKVTIRGVSCDGAALRRALLLNEPDFYSTLEQQIVDSHDDKEMERILDELCEKNSGTRYLQEEASVPFHKVTQRGYQFDKNYFDGETSWNKGLYPVGKNLDAGRIEQIEQSLKKTILEWPTPEDADYKKTPIPNFADCDLGVVMCCFTQEQDAVTGINTPMDPNVANANVCHHDMKKSKRASHTKNGLTFMTDGRETQVQINNAYCSGFAWDPTDANSTSTKYRANTLYFVSMLQGFYRDSFVASVPGSPMCGCVEQMPTVTKSACFEPVETIDIESPSRNRRGLQLNTKIEFEPCINATHSDLLEYYRGMRGYDTEDAVRAVDALASKLVGDGKCDEAVDEVLAKMAYKRGSAWWYADSSTWTPLYGKNDLYHPSIGTSGFRRAYEASSTKIIRYVCKSCNRVYRNVYYRRNATETELPSEMDLLKYLTSSWTKVNNEFHVDFDLYSSYQEAKDRVNPWTVCNFSSSRGFPNECGPDGNVYNQWASTNAKSYAKDFAFYLEK